MAEEFSCNCCGKLTDVGYFYCSECHRIHKEQKQKDKDSVKTSLCCSEILKKEVIPTDSKAKE